MGHAETFSLKPRDGCSNCRVLHWAGYHMPWFILGPSETENGQIVGLRATRGKDHLARIRSKNFGDYLSGAVPTAPGPTAK
jgi:hypothetical protein